MPTAKKRVSSRKTRPVSEKEFTPIDIPAASKPSFFSSPTKVISLFIFLVLVYFFVSKNIKGGGSNTNNLKTTVLPQAIKKIINNDAIKVTIDNIKENHGVYQFDLSLDQGQGTPQKYVSYISKDGKVLFQSGIDLDTLNNTAANTANQETTKKLTCSDVKKGDQPKLTAYVVSNCPYGLQMQRVFKRAIAEQPALANYLDVKYIGSVADGKITSMHGDKEAEENLRQICIREEQKDKYWNYVSCYMKEGKTEDCEKTANINMQALNSCTSDANKGLKYAQVDFDQQKKNGISSSPTLLTNDNQTVSEFDFGGRTANAVKELVCCAANNKPDFCGKELSKDSAAVAFSANDTTTNTNTSAANCGN